MRTDFRRKCWLKLAAAAVACGTLFQASTCNSTPIDLGEQLVVSIADQWIVSYFSNQFNVSGSFF